MYASNENISTMTMTVPKQPLRRVEIPLNKFNDVAVPLHVDLLKRRKINIEKFQQTGDWDKMHREQINATRDIKQLKALLYEMDMLRNQVQESDLEKFDKLTDNSRKCAQEAIEEYLVLYPQSQSPVWITSRDNSIDSTEILSKEREHETTPDEETDLKMQLSTSSSVEELAKQEECLKSWENLQAEVQDIHRAFEDFALIVKEQKEKVDQAEDNVEIASENVSEGTRLLSRAAKYKAAMYPVAGALLGGCLGGPIGLVAGLKFGGLAAIGCGVIGFTGGQILKKKQELQESRSDVELVEVHRPHNLRSSKSLPYISDLKTETSRNS